MINYIKGLVPGDDYFWDLFKDNGWESDLLNLLKSKLTRDSVYVDIGSWIGPTVLTAAEVCDHVYAIEPDEVAYQALLKNIEANPDLVKNIQTNKLAIMNYNGLTKLGIQGQEGNSMSSVLSPNNVKDVRCTTLETYLAYKHIKKVDFIKVDTEGAELHILPELAAIWEEIGKPTIHLSLHQTWYQKPTDLQIVMDFLACVPVSYEDRQKVKTEQFSTIVI